MKKTVALLLAVAFVASLAGCGGSARPAAEAGRKVKIGVMTGTVAQNEEEFRAAEKMTKKYGKNVVLMKTYPDNFILEQDTTIANLLAFADDPDVKAIILCQAVPGASAAFGKIREKRPDILLIAASPAEDYEVITGKADLVLQLDLLAMGNIVPRQAKKMGAKTFVHYSFPRHMAYPMLAQRRDIMEAECRKIGLRFVDATAPDPLSEAGLPATQQFILEDVPKKVKEFGKETNFFSTNCGMQEPLIKAVLEAGAIDAQQCCPSPLHGYPGALEIRIPPEKAGDIPYLVEQIKAQLAARNGAGRFATWPIPVNMLFVEAGIEYAKDWAEGKIKDRNDAAALEKKMAEISGTDVRMSTYKGKDKTGADVEFKNLYLIFSDYIVF